MKYVALLRGINVGGNKKVEMKRLKACIESSGFTNVSTYINSGNVIFESPKKSEAALAVKIERAIFKEFGFEVQTIVRTAGNITKVARSVPIDWENNSEQKTDILFLWDDYANKKTLQLLETNKKVDSLLYVEKAIVWHLLKKNYGKSGMNKLIGTNLYKNITVRNVNTVRKLAALLEL